MAKYVYPAIFSAEKEGGYSITFPDVDGCFTQGESIEDGLEMAMDALCLTMYGLEEDKKPIPPATNINDIKPAEDEFVTLVFCDTLDYKRYFEAQFTEKTATA